MSLEVSNKDATEAISYRQQEANHCCGAFRQSNTAGKALPNHHSGGVGGNHLPGASHPDMQPPHAPARPGLSGTPWGAQHPSPSCSPSPLRRKLRCPADVRRHHFTQRPGFLAGKGWGSREEGEEEPGAKASHIFSSPCAQRGSSRDGTPPSPLIALALRKERQHHISQCPSQEPQCCPADLQQSMHSFKDAQKKRLKFILICSSK